MKYKPYEPYKTKAFTDLLGWAFNQAWYSGERNLITIRMNGEFEGYSGHASETWEHQFVVENCDIPDIGIKAHSAVGETVEEACTKLLAMIKADEKGV